MGQSKLLEISELNGTAGSQEDGQEGSPYVLLALTSLIKYNLTIPSMVVVRCKECVELIYLTPHAFWNITDFGVKCENAMPQIQ